MANAHSLDGLMKWVSRAEWRDALDEVLDWHLGPACAEAELGLDDLAALIGEEHFTVLWGCIFEDLLAYEFEDGHNIVDDYVKRRGWKETVANRTYILALRSSVMSLYEISDVVAEESFLARDLIRGGDPIRISEKTATRSLKPWDHIAARVVQMGTRAEMGGGVLPFDHESSEEILKSIHEACREARAEAAEKVRESGAPVDEAMSAGIAAIFSETEILRTSAFVFTNAWLGNLIQDILSPRVPKLCNSDGEPLVLVTARYPLTATNADDAIQTSFAAIPGLRAENKAFWNWTKPQKRRRRKRPTEGHMLVTTLDDGSVVLGTMELNEGTLVLSVNSEARLQQGRALIEPALAGLVGEPLIERQSVEQLMASKPRGAAKPSSGMLPDEERAVIHEALTAHYRRTLDEPIPGLGNRTPRKAAGTKQGREKVVAWLKLIENDAAHQPESEPIASYDFSWMWQELGIADQRG